MRKLSLLTLFAIVMALGTAVTTAQAAAPSLTSTEYQQLLAFQHSTSTRKLKTLASIESAKRSCRKLSPASPLLRAGRSDCNATFSWLEATVHALARIKACAPQHTVAGRFPCLMSAYSRLAARVRGLYRADSHLHAVVVARGFTGACERALSDGSQAIAHERQMANDITKLVAAMHQRKLLAVQKWGSLYDAATAEAEASAKKASILTCPHQ